MTTQVTLSDSVVNVRLINWNLLYILTALQRLVKLGVKMVEKPSECTHLIAPHLVRTEKLLCAIAAQAFILKSEWATASAAANELLRMSTSVLSSESSYNVPPCSGRELRPAR